METKKLHPLIPGLHEELSKGRISRREFLRFSTLLGLSVASAEILAACALPTQMPVSPSATVTQTRPEQASLVRGGVIRCAARIERVDHPARFTQPSQSHPWRHVLEYLTCTGPKGITTPYLLERWEASLDLRTWTLFVRKGIKFNNGQELTAQDVIFNFNQWLNQDLNSTIASSLSYLEASGVVQKDDYTVVLNLNAPTIFVPEHLFQYPAAILPQTFGGNIQREPVGTGAFNMAEYVPGERCRLIARQDYWRNGADGRPLPYLDEIVMLQFGEDRSADLAALQTGQVDTILEPPLSNWAVLKHDPRFSVVSTPTAATYLLRFRVDQEPWKDNQVRQAIKYCHNREKILSAALQGQGSIGNDSHVAPAQAEFTPLDPYPFKPVEAKALLAKAGHPDGVTVELTVPSDWPVAIAYAQALKEDAAAGGFTINLKLMPAAQYWENWTEWNFGITWWAHNTQATMLLPLVYSTGQDGSPAPWNETRWVDPQFSKTLEQAEGTLDLPQRKKQVELLEKIQKERGSICTPFFTNVWEIHDQKFHGIVPSPESYANFYETWKEI
jgi:peptide/nickel transport system substrate-binding protein